jgi:VanZ family protein
MLYLRYRRVWFALGWLLVAGVVLGSLAPGTNMRHLIVDDKILHFGSYFLLMVWFSGLYERTRHYALIAVTLIILGVCLDLLQGLMTTRYFDVYDVLANVIGTICGLVLAVMLIGGWCARIERLLSTQESIR